MEFLDVPADIRSVRYRKLNKNLNTFVIPKIITYIPSPTDDDYKRGYITRYFIQKANDDSGYVYELNADSIYDFATTPFYIIQNLKWRLSGTADEVRESNFKSVKLASQKMKGLLLYLPNYLQFYKY
jgi:hypothetical protein